MADTYKIIRFFANERKSTVIKRGLTEAQARAHTNNPETSSRTATGEKELARTADYGPWFDGSERE